MADDARPRWWWPFTRRVATPEVEERSFVAPTVPVVYPSGGMSFADVDLSAAESSLQSVAVHASVDLIASLASEMPVHVYSGEGPDRRRRPTPRYLEDPAGDGQGLPDWIYQVITSWLLRGNLYGDILATAGDRYPTQVLLHHPDAVSCWMDDGRVVWSVNGREVTNPERFLHRRVNPMPGRVKGLSPIAFHATQIGLSLSAGRFGKQWFEDGAHPSGLLLNEERNLTPEQSRAAKDAYMAAVFNSREPVVLDKGWKYLPLSVSAEESQFLATQGFTEAQCARIFGPGLAEVLGYESGGSLTYATVEGRSQHLLVYSLNKWLVRVERLLTSMLPAPQYAKLDRDALLQSTTLDRYRAHESALKNRWKTPNEVRSDEDMPPVPWGDEPNSTTPAAPPAKDEPADKDEPAEGEDED